MPKININFILVFMNISNFFTLKIGQNCNYTIYPKLH
jgi:hypothetical protein